MTPQQGRALLRDTSREVWAEKILAELEPPHADIRVVTTRLDVFRNGHAMARPVPGLVWGDPRQRFAADAARIRFAHADVSGLSLFEEAQYRGVLAAERTLRRLQTLRYFTSLKVYSMHGLHLIADLHECCCEPRLLSDAGALRDLCLAVCSTPGLTPVGEVFHQFGSIPAPAGATGAVVLAESHLAIHTWPELGAVTLDLYVCNFSQDNSTAARAACERLITAFAPRRLIRRELQRGVPAEAEFATQAA